jgi:hypothetical protein
VPHAGVAARPHAAHVPHGKSARQLALPGCPAGHARLRPLCAAERRPGESVGLVADAIAEAESIRSRPGPLIPNDVVEAMMDADDGAHDAMAAALDAHARENLSPDSVRAMWEAVKARHGSA